jgi:PsbN protein
MNLMEPAIALNIGIAAVVIALTGYAIYTAFGPASADLRDPFEEHED